MSLTTLRHKLAAIMRDPDDSYAHMGEDGSDVELVEVPAGYIECVDCKLEADGFYATWDVSSMIGHVRDHKTAGHEVPAYVIPRLGGN